MSPVRLARLAGVNLVSLISRKVSSVTMETSGSSAVDLIAFSAGSEKLISSSSCDFEIVS